MILNQIDNARLGTDQVDKIYLGADEIWENTPPTPVPYDEQYLTIEALETGTLNVRKAITYSINEGTWVTSTGETALSLNQGDKVRFKGNLSSSDNMLQNNSLPMTVYGNIQSLFYGDNFEDQTTAKTSDSLFLGCTGLVDASNLVLPATTLYDVCYSGMFSGCTSLTIAPELPATILVYRCYRNMFRDCTSLNHIKCLATDISAPGCVSTWVKNVSTTGTFVKNPAMNDWTTAVSGIPEGWTVQDA